MQRPIIKDKAVEAYVLHLEEELLKYKKSPYLKTYLTLKSQLDDFNEQLTIRTGKVKVKQENGDIIEVEMELGRVDLFADPKDKSFDRTKWYFDNMLSLNKQLDDLRKLMTPEDIKAIQEKEKMDNLGIAERLALGK